MTAGAGCDSGDPSSTESVSFPEAPATGSGTPATLADSLVHRWIRAAGGLEAWRSVRSARFTVTTVWYEPDGAVRRMRPRRVAMRKTPEGTQARIERPEPEGLYVQVFTGDTAWATLDGQPLPPDDPAAEETEYVARDVAYWIGLPYKLRDPGVNLSARRLDDGDFELRVTFEAETGAHPGDRYFYYFPAGDPHPERVDYIEEGSESRSRTRWSHFRRAGPLSYVGVRRWVDEEGTVTRELRQDDVCVNPVLPDSLFRPSPRVAPADS